MENSISLVIAARTLGVSRDVAMRLILTGQIHGEQIAGRWMCDRESVERERERRAGAVAASA